MDRVVKWANWTAMWWYGNGLYISKTSVGGRVEDEHKFALAFTNATDAEEMYKLFTNIPQNYTDTTKDPYCDNGTAIKTFNA